MLLCDSATSAGACPVRWLCLRLLLLVRAMVPAVGMGAAGTGVMARREGRGGLGK